MALWVTVQGFVNREYLEEQVLNRPIRQLRERTDYLYGRVRDLADSDTLSSLRLVDVPLSTDTAYAPSVGDIIYLNPTTKVYEQALATIDVAANMLYEVDYPGYAMGILLSTSSDGSTGTVVIMGKITLADTGNWDLESMVESTEDFRSGPYYLSGTERGKLTRYPNGPEIYIGYFSDDADAPGTGGHALLNPHYRSFAEAHIHQSFPLNMQPVGSFNADNGSVLGFPSNAAGAISHGAHDAVAGATLTDSSAAFVVGNLEGLRLYNRTQGISATITANTATTITAAMSADWEPGDVYYIEDRHRLVTIGNYTETDTTDYTCVLTGADGVSAPTGIGDLYVTYTSSDPLESGQVQLFGYENPVALGTKGLQVYLKLVSTATDVDMVEEAADADRRTYQFTAATDTEGWVDNQFHVPMVADVATDFSWSLSVVGGPTDADADSILTVNVKTGPSVGLVWSGVPADGDTLDIAGVTFEFDDDNSVSGSNIRVNIISGDAESTYRELQAAVLAEELLGVIPVLHTEGDALVIVRDSGSSEITASITNCVATATAVTPTTLVATTDAQYVVYDRYFESMVTTTSPYVALGTAWANTNLVQDLRLNLIPYAPDGTPTTGLTAYAGDSWSAELNNEGRGMARRYNIGMNPGLSAFYPAIPLRSASFVLNGLELESFEHFPDAADYKVGYHGFYWAHPTTNYPWPEDWELGGSDFDDEQLAVLYLVRPRAGESGIVRTLQAAPDAPVTITRCGTNDPASTGDLQIDVDLSLRQRNDELSGYHVFKRVQGNRLLSGPVVSRILPGPGYSVVSPVGVPNGYGDVQLQLTSANMGGDFEEIALQNAKHELIGLFPYIRLLGWDTAGGNNVPSGFTAKFNLPPDLDGLYQFVVSMTLFGEEDIASGREIAGMDFTYTVLHDYMPDPGYRRNLITSLITPATDPIKWEVPLGEEAAAYTAFDPMLVHTSQDEPADDPARAYRASDGPYPVAGDLLGGVIETSLDNLVVQAGSQIAIQIQRADITSGTEYTGALGILNLRWRLVPFTATIAELPVDSITVIDGGTAGSGGDTVIDGGDSA